MENNPNFHSFLFQLIFVASFWVSETKPSVEVRRIDKDLFSFPEDTSSEDFGDDNLDNNKLDSFESNSLNQ